jgi:hypothetical protein
VGVNKGNIVRKRLYFNKVTGLSGWMDEDEKPSKDNWIACRVDPYFNWAKEVIGKLNKDLRELEKLVRKKWDENKIYYLDHLSEIRRVVEIKEKAQDKESSEIKPAKKVEVETPKVKQKKSKKKTKKKQTKAKKSKVMNKGLQIAKLKQFLKKHGIDPDLVDLEALVDSTLTYRENKENIMGQLGISEGITVKPSHIELQEIEDAIRQAQMYHEMRSERAQKMDESKVAKIPKDPEAWFRHPERYDLPEVDYPDPNYSVEDYLKDIKQKKQKKRRRRKSKNK